jgi:beta-galactosidase
MGRVVLPISPYGAVYFRKSNPPRADWARDYQVAAEDGMNVFRHWFLWSAIEVAPGEFDWDDYDQQLDLAARYGLKTIVAEMITAAPEWAWRQLSHARLQARDGSPAHSQMSASCVVGGFPGLCLDSEDVRDLAGAFLRTLVLRYRHHPGLGGYDVWNECNVPAAYCYCPATAECFRAWLRERYGKPGLRELAKAWQRPSYTDLADVEPPRSNGPYPEVLDWLQFRIENAYHWLRWRVELIRSLDLDHPITAHGVALSLSNMADTCCDEWRAAAEVDIYGFTWVAARRGNEPWKQWHAVDLVRAGARGKPFWHAEAQAGPLWMQPQVLGRPRQDGRIAEPEDVRLWNLVSMAGGATGYLYPRWRPLLDGPLFGAFGPYAMDGSRTPRSDVASRMARWAAAPQQAELWAARPVRGELGIVVAPESQLFCFAQQASTDCYAQAARGAYQAFFEQDIQADWVHIRDIGDYDVLYLPCPLMLSSAAATALRSWVQAGGRLIAEGCPGYFGDRGHAGPSQPGLGLNELFGVRERYVEFTADLLDDLTFEIGGAHPPGGVVLQTYTPTTGVAVGHYADGQVAVVDNTFGLGRTRLIGTLAGVGHYRHPGLGSRALFADLQRWAGLRPRVRVGTPGVVARLHHDAAGASVLWIVNHNHEPVDVQLDLPPELGSLDAAHVYWGEPPTAIDGQRTRACVGGRDALVARLRCA